MLRSYLPKVMQGQPIALSAVNGEGADTENIAKPCAPGQY